MGKYTAGDILAFDSGFGRHYHVIVIGSVGESEQKYILVYLSTSTGQPDTTTTFIAGEDKFITERSWVKYASAFTIDESALMRRTDMKYYGRAKPAVFTKVLEGFLKGMHVPRGIREIYYEWKDKENWS
ncbi:MAG: hypothetical protein AB2L21_00530 [Anaerolineaceae bacterium]